MHPDLNFYRPLKLKTGLTEVRSGHFQRPGVSGSAKDHFDVKYDKKSDTALEKQGVDVKILQKYQNYSRKYRAIPGKDYFCKKIELWQNYVSVH